MNPRCPLCGGTLEEVKLHGLEVLTEPNAKCNKCGATTVIHWTEHRAKQKTFEKIKAAIDAKQLDFMADKDYDKGVRFGLLLAYQIVDKESEDKK